MHEPLTIAILYHYLSHRPWELRQAPILLELANTLHGVWKSSGMPERSLLRELWVLQRNLASMPESLAWKILYGKLDNYIQDSTTQNHKLAAWRKERQEDRFVRPRNGDMLCALFQCDYCWFFTLKKRHVNSASPSDCLLLAYIRRVNLDMMWSQEESTV